MNARKLRFCLLAGAAFVLTACAGDYLPASPYYAPYSPSIPLYSNATLPGYSDTIVSSDRGSTVPSYGGVTTGPSYTGAAMPSYSATAPTSMAPPGYTVEPPYLGYRFYNGAYYGWRNPAGVPMNHFDGAHHIGGVPHSNNMHPVGGPRHIAHIGAFGHPGAGLHVGGMHGGAAIGGGHRG
jgi:hypothetical protein